MTLEDLLAAIAIIIKNNADPKEAAKIVNFLYTNHPFYELDKVDAKVVHKETKKDISLIALGK